MTNGPTPPMVFEKCRFRLRGPDRKPKSWWSLSPAPDVCYDILDVVKLHDVGVGLRDDGLRSLGYGRSRCAVSWPSRMGGGHAPWWHRGGG